MTDNEIAIRQKLKDDFIHYASRCLKIRTKEGEVKEFTLNKAQQYIHKRLEEQKGCTGKVRALILKGRQQGCSTYVGGRFYHKTTHSRGMQCFILTHALDATNNLFKMAQRYYENTPELVRPSVSTNNSKELIFGGLDSGYKVGTAENKNVGRSSTIQYLHCCLAEGTPIYDPILGSVRNIEDFIIGDGIQTHTGKTAAISFISTQKKECISVKFRTLTSFPLLATAEHECWTKSGWKKLGELNVGDSIGFPVTKIVHSIKYLEMPDPVKRAHGGGRQYNAPKTIPLNYEFGRVIGLYLAEGHIKLQSKHPFGVSNVSFTIHRNETKRTLDWLMPFDAYFSSINVKHIENCLTSRITVYGSQFAALMNYICGRTHGKRIPKMWYISGKDFCRGMLHGYISGDGHSNIKNRTVSAPSICPSITITLRNIAASLGYGWASIAHQYSAIRHGRNEKEQYIFRLCGAGAIALAKEVNKPILPMVKTGQGSAITEISNGYAWVRIKEIENAGIKTVYDFEVDHDDHSYCTIHGAVSNSEVAFWNNASDHATGIMQAIPDASHTEIIMESTANGVGNYFHQMWQRAEGGLSDFIAIFVPWFWQEEYKRAVPDDFKLDHIEYNLKEAYGLSDEQLAWRRFKIIDLSVNGQDGEKSFCQEYPCNANEAFQLTGENTFIDSAIVLKARKTEVEKYGPLVMGVDPARFGDDRTSIILRQGRVAFDLQSFAKKDTMEVTGIVHSLIDKHRPAKVFIDVGGLGAGVVDRLFELGHRDSVVPVNAGSKPLDERKFSNKRAEMWGLCAQWLSDFPCRIPDSDSLHADLCGIRYTFDSNSRLVMERKEDMKKRGVRSPDESDALCFVAGTLIQTPSGKIPIEKLKIGDEVVTPFGNTKIGKCWVSETDLITTVNFSNGSVLSGKGAHKIFTWQTGGCRLDALSFTFEVESYSKWSKFKWVLLKPLLIKDRNSEFKHLVDIISHTRKVTLSAFFIVTFGQTTTVLSQKVTSFITKIMIGVTTIFPIWRLCHQESTPDYICENGFQSQRIERKIKRVWQKLFSKPQRGISQRQELHGINNTPISVGKISLNKVRINLHVQNAQMNSNLTFQTQDSVPNHVDKKDVMLNKKQVHKSVLGAIKNLWQINIGKWNVVPSSVQTENVPMTKVYNLTLLKHNAYYANDILAFNCLTFAMPVTALVKKEDEAAKTVRSFAQDFSHKLNTLKRARNGNNGR